MVTGRTALVAAVAVVVFYVIAAAIVGTPLSVETSASDSLSWLQSHRTDIQTSSVFVNLALIAFLTFVGVAAPRLGGAYGWVFAASGAAMVAQIAAGQWLVSGAALHADSISAGTARALLDVNAYWGPMLTGTDVALAGAVALCWYRERTLPGWVGILSAIFALEQLAESATLCSSTGFAAPGGVWNNEVGAGLFMIWLLALGFGISRRRT